jgi:mycothione reductase
VYVSIASFIVTHFDLIIIGSGSGNSVITHEMTDWRIAVIEESAFGGTCLNVGCIPTKMYVYAADVASTIRQAERYGIDAHIDGVRWRDIRDRIFGRIDPISAAGRRHRQHSDNVALFEQHAEFLDPRTVRLADGHVLTADQIVIATGSRVTVPHEVLEAGIEFDTSDTIMRIEALPERLIILGGGYVAAEFAHVFEALGCPVAVVTRGSQLMRRLDEEIGHRFTELARSKWDVRLNAQIASITRSGAEIHVALADGTSVAGDRLLVATGRRPNTDRLGLEAAGVELTEDGRVVVDEFQRTTAPGVWALGDASSADQLKHVANQDARIVAHNLRHPDALRVSNHEHIPSAVFSEPQLATVGLTETQAREQGLDVATATQTYGSTAYGWAMEDTTSVIKLVAERGTGRLLGAHLMGPQASNLIQPLTQAMVFGQRVDELARAQYWIHPALIEVVENALLQLDLQPSTP